MTGLSPVYTTKQRVDVNVNNVQNHSSTWELLKQGFPHGSVLGPLLFVACLSDLPWHINHFTNVVLSADDNSILITEKVWKSKPKD